MKGQSFWTPSSDSHLFGMLLFFLERLIPGLRRQSVMTNHLLNAYYMWGTWCWVLTRHFYTGSHNIPFREITTNLILQMAMQRLRGNVILARSESQRITIWSPPASGAWVLLLWCFKSRTFKLEHAAESGLAIIWITRLLHLQGFGFCWLGAGPKNLHCWHVPRWCCCCWPGTRALRTPVALEDGTGLQVPPTLKKFYDSRIFGGENKEK